jgi:hypothetical protein
LAIILTIGGVEKPFVSGSLSIHDELNTRGRCKFKLWDESGEYYPETGAVVRVVETYADEDGETLIEVEKFEGTLDEPEESIPGGVQSGHFIDCEAVSYDQLCDRYHVTHVYANQSAKQIIADAFTNSAHCSIYLEGVDAETYVQDTEPIEKIVANYISVTDLLNDLSKLTGYKWYVDSDKQLHFFDRTTVPAPFGLNDDVDNFANFKLRRTRQDYRNKQIVRGGTTTTDPLTEEVGGNGRTRTFTLKHNVAEMNGITVYRYQGGTHVAEEQIVAVQGTEGAEWTYLKGSDTVNHNSGTVMGPSDYAKVAYVGEFPIAAAIESDEEIESRRGVEGGGGIYEHIDFDDSIESEETAKRKAYSLLDAYAKIPRMITFETTERGLKAGQAIQIKLARYRLDDEFLITRVDTKDKAGKHLFYTVRCVGSEYDSWVQYFRDAFKKPKRLVAHENEKLILMRSLKNKARARQFVTYSVSARPTYIDEDTELGFAEVEEFSYAFIAGGLVVPCRI